MNSDPGPRPELTWLPVDRLDVDPAYQRSLDTPKSRRLIARIAGNFRWAAFQSILATPNGPERWWLIDGQHRAAAARLAGLSLVPAVVVHELATKDQALAFVSANADRNPVPPQAVFYAKLVAGDAAALELQAVCAATGIELLRYPLAAAKTPQGKTSAIPALQKVQRNFPAVWRAAIAAVGAWGGGRRGALRGEIFYGAARFLHRHGDEAALAAALRRVGLGRLEEAIALANGMGAAAAAIAELLATRRAAAPTQPAAPAERAAPPQPAVPVGMFRFADDPRARREGGSPGRLPTPQVGQAQRSVLA